MMSSSNTGSQLKPPLQPEPPANPCDHGPSSTMSFDLIKDDSDEEESRISTNPPIQNGFVVFIHECKVISSAKTRRTVVQWIRDALKILDIVPKVVTVESLLEMTSTNVSNPTGEPIIKYTTIPPNSSPLRAPSTDKKIRAIEGKRSIKNIASKAVLQARKNTTGKASKISFPSLKTSAVSGKFLKSGESSKKSSHNPSRPISQTKAVKSSHKQSANKFNNNDEKIIEERGVDTKIFKEHVRALHQGNVCNVWALLVETKQRCMVDLCQLNKLASTFRFHIRWIAAQAPSLLDQTVFSVVNDIIQTRNICFPEQSKLLTAEPTVASPLLKKSVTKLKKRRSKSKSSVEVLHKASAEEFDAMSIASLELRELINEILPSVEPTAETVETSSLGDLDGQYPLKRQLSREEIHKAIAEDETNCNDVEVPPRRGLTRHLKHKDSLVASLPSREQESKRLVQLALITARNPFASTWVLTDFLGFNGLFEVASQEFKKRSKLQTTQKFEADEATEANPNAISGFKADHNFKRVIHAVRKKFKRRPFCAWSRLVPKATPGSSLSTARLLDTSFLSRANSQGSLLCSLGDNSVANAPTSVSASFVPLVMKPLINIDEKYESQLDVADVTNVTELTFLNVEDDESFESIDLSDDSSHSQAGDDSAAEDDQVIDYLNICGTTNPRQIHSEYQEEAEKLRSIVLSNDESLECTKEAHVLGPYTKMLEQRTHEAISNDGITQNQERADTLQAKTVGTHRKMEKKVPINRLRWLDCFSRLCDCATVVRDT